MKSTVSLQKCSSYDQKAVDYSVSRLINNLGGINKFIKRNSKVLLKPNLVKAAKPEDSITTHPAVIEAIAKILLKQKCEIYVGDDPFSADMIKALETSGIHDVCKKYGLKIAKFRERTKIIYKNGMVVKDFNITNYFDFVDSIINVPKLKTHCQLYYTGAIKNLYSMMPGPKRGYYHLKYSNMEKFANMLIDLYCLLKRKITLNIIDGVYGMEGNGPTSGVPKFAGVLGASQDAAALDYVMCKLIGLNVGKSPLIEYSRIRKEIMLDPDKILIRGHSFDSIKVAPFREADEHSLYMMPKFRSLFKEYIEKRKDELIYQ